MKTYKLRHCERRRFFEATMLEARSNPVRQLAIIIFLDCHAASQLAMTGAGKEAYE
jgi:hypothetical protein